MKEEEPFHKRSLILSPQHSLCFLQEHISIMTQNDRLSGALPPSHSVSHCEASARQIFLLPSILENIKFCSDLKQNSNLMI